MPHPMPNTDAWIHITPGRGPVECKLAAQRTLNVLQAEASTHGFASDVLEHTDAGSVVLRLSGQTSELAQFVRTWIGTVQCVGASPLRPNHRRKNFFVGVSALWPPTQGVGSILPSEIEVQTMRASGPGGQHVNRTESAVRIHHRPTGIITQAQEERSQHRNKALAMARLHAALAHRSNMEAKAAKRTQWQANNTVERGNPIRTLYGL